MKARPIRRNRLQPTDIAWVALGTYVFGCNLILREQLSVAVDRYLLVRRRTTEVILLAMYLHLSNRVPPRFDPIHLLFASLLRSPRRRSHQRRGVSGSTL
jgi:hypothetical protein